MTQPKAEGGDSGVGTGLARHGKLSYVQIPAQDPVSLGRFYEAVFGWSVGGSPEHVRFRDTSGELIGAFVSGRPISSEPGILPYIYVSQIDAMVASIEAHDGHVVAAPYPEEDLWVATFRDPAGNVMGVWQAGPRRD